MKSLFLGADTLCPTLQGKKPYVYLDNGASTPSLKCVQDAVTTYMPYYSSVHRGSGFKSLLSTHLFESCRSTVLEFVNASTKDHVCIFTKNTTESINKLSKRFPFTEEKFVVLTTGMEHHADDLPWREAYAPKTVHINILVNGELDMSDFFAKLALYSTSIALVAITAASNVTGVLNPIHEIARLAHEVGAQIFVDCAQIVAHRAVDMKALDDPEHLDYIAFSGHKMYAPFGTGVLVGRRDTFNQGGGAVMLVTLDSVVWAQTPERDEAGSPNIPGTIALQAAILMLQRITFKRIASHESALTSYFLTKLSLLPGVRIFGDADSSTASTRVGVIPFTLEPHSPDLISTILSHEFGIGIRSGCFCAHPLITRLLDVEELIGEISSRLERGDACIDSVMDKPGLLRVSFGMYNDVSDVDALIDALWCIVDGKYKGKFVKRGESWEPEEGNDCFEEYVDIKAIVDAVEI